jgi:hemoglobin
MPNRHRRHDLLVKGVVRGNHGGPQVYAATKPGSTHLGLEEAHRALEISPAIFDEVAAELGRSLDHFNVPESEKGEVLAAFAAHKGEVIEGYSQQY